MRVSVGRFIVWRESDRRFLVLAAALAIVLGVLVSTFYVVFTTTRVSGPSMEPALYHDDRLLLTRSYDDPRRGDIVSATVPDEIGRPTDVIKRVVALPGDTVEIVGDSAYVNGALVAGSPTDAGAGIRTAPLVVPERSVYLLGDNRPVSYDSRIIGPVPVTSVDGVAVAIIAPLHRFSIMDR